MKKYVEAYFVVEAAMVLPLVISAIVLVVSLFVFQYDRCLMEQDVAAQALKSAVVEADSTKELTEKMQMQIAELYRNKYVAWDLTMLDIKLEKGIIEAVGRGKFSFLLPEWNLWNEKNDWDAQAIYKAHRIVPVDFIRNCRKIKGGK